MSMRKFVVAAVAAFAFVIAPSLLSQSNSANALPAAPVEAGVLQSTMTVVPVIAGMVVVASVILNAAIVSQTQCRQLTQQEAFNSILLPLLGIALNRQRTMCGRRR